MPTNPIPPELVARSAVMDAACHAVADAWEKKNVSVAGALIDAINGVPAAAALTACRSCKGRGGVQEDIGDGQYVGAECPVCCGHGFSEDIEDGVWSAIMEAQGPDSNARDYAKAALLYLARDTIAALINPSPIDREAVPALSDILYLVACAESHADKFPVPTHMRELCARIRLALLPAHPVEPQDVQTFPDIGAVHPLQMGQEERAKRDDRLRAAFSVQQKGVPDQTALVWRSDLIDWWHELVRSRARLEALATPTPVPADGALPALIADAKDRLRLTKGCDMANADDERFWRDVIAFLERREPWFTTTASDATTGASATAGATTDTADGALREALDGYRAAVSYISADSWDGCSDCIEILRAARSLDVDWDWAGDPDRIARELKRVRTAAALSTPDQSQPESNGS